MKILVTGASGFIGSFIVEEALNRGEVWAGLRASSSKKYLPFPDLNFIDIPYSKRDEAVALLKEHKEKFGKWDVIIHNMGLTKCKHISDFDRVNFEYTKNPNGVYNIFVDKGGYNYDISLKQVDNTIQRVKNKINKEINIKDMEKIYVKS